MAVPDITFAIPYYSGKEYLALAIRSVLAQTDPHWVCIVCDDSSDPTIEAFVHEVGEGRVRYAKNPTNLGIDGNFNRCLDVAETDLAVVLHADDQLLPCYAGTIRAAAEQYPDAVAIFCRAEIMGPDGGPWSSVADLVKRKIDPTTRGTTVLHGEPGLRLLVPANWIVAPTLCFRPSRLGARRFPVGKHFVLDWAFTTQLLLDGETLVGLQDVCFRYRRHHNAMTEQLGRSMQRYIEESAFYEHLYEVTRARGWHTCAQIAKKKRLLKLNVTYRALKSLAGLQVGEAKKTLHLLRTL